MTETGQVPNAAEVADRFAIMDVLNMHSRGVDRASAEILKSAYWPNAKVDYGAFKGNAHQWCEGLPAGIRHYAGTQHKISNIAIEFKGDEAKVETYVTAYHYLAVLNGDDTEMTYIGRYFDDMEKRDNVWKIKFRKICMDWHQNALVTHDDDNPGLNQITRGGRQPEDPLFSFLNGESS